MKKTIVFMICIAMLMGLVGCSGGTDPEHPITLTMWHVYGSQTESPLNDVIDEFNRTVGQEKGIIIKVVSVMNSSDIDAALISSANGEPGTVEMPDLFTAYPRIVESIGEEKLLDWDEYMLEEELSNYREDFLAEGYFRDALYMLPIAKSTETMFLNKTLFDRFAEDTGISLEDLATVEGVMDACNAYCDWSGGGTFYQINELYYYFLSNMAALGEEMIKDGSVDADSDAFENVFLPLAEAGIYGGLCVGDGFASDRWKTAEVICNVGSTASVLYLRDYVTYTDNTTENVEMAVLPYPVITGGDPTVVQRGVGLFGMHSDVEAENKAKVEFVRWLCEKQHNLDFVTKAGYLPPTNEAFEELFENLSAVENEKYQMLYGAIQNMYQDGYTFCTIPLFEGAGDFQPWFEQLIKYTLSTAHETYVERVNAGEDPAMVMEELLSSSLEEVRAVLR